MKMKDAIKIVESLGGTLRPTRIRGEYVLRMPLSPLLSPQNLEEYYTEDLADAVATARAIARRVAMAVPNARPTLVSKGLRVTTPAAAIEALECDVSEIIARIKDRVSQARATNSTVPQHSTWAGVEEFTAVRNRLAEVLAQLGDRSAVEELELRY